MPKIAPKPHILEKAKAELRDYAIDYFRNAIPQQTSDYAIERMQTDFRMLVVAQAKHLLVDAYAPDTFTMRAQRLWLVNVPPREEDMGIATHKIRMGMRLLMDMVDALGEDGKRALFLESFLDQRENLLGILDVANNAQAPHDPDREIDLIDLKLNLKQLDRAIRFLGRR